MISSFFFCVVYAYGLRLIEYLGGEVFVSRIFRICSSRFAGTAKGPSFPLSRSSTGVVLSCSFPVAFGVFLIFLSVQMRFLDRGVLQIGHRGN